MERFEESCDRIPDPLRGSSIGPTLQDLADLGIIAIPRLVGGFLAGPSVAHAAESENVDGDDGGGVNCEPCDNEWRGEVDDDNVSLGSLSSEDFSDILDMLEDDPFEELGDEDVDVAQEDLDELAEDALGACTAFMWFTIRV